MATARLRWIFWTLVVAAWASGLVLGSLWIRWHPREDSAAKKTSPADACLDAAAKRPMPGFTARRALAVNHLVRSDDLDWTSPSGAAHPTDVLARYSTCAVEKGGRLVVAETAAMPTIAAPSGRVSYPFLLDANAQASETINAGSTIDIFDGATLVTRGVPVLAVQCRANSTTDCTAIIGVAADDLPRLRAADPKNALIVIMTKS